MLNARQHDEEQAGNRIFVNVPDAKQVALIDRGKRSVAETWPMELHSLSGNPPVTE